MSSPDRVLKRADGIFEVDSIANPTPEQGVDLDRGFLSVFPLVIGVRVEAKGACKDGGVLAR